MNKNDLLTTIDNVINNIKTFISSFLDTDIKKAKNIIYWLKYHFIYLQDEENFLNRKSYKKYKYGQIINISLGYNLGRELGGVHYAVVMNVNDTPTNSNLIVVPLSSKKNEKKLGINDTRIDIGSEFKDILSKKYSDFEEQNNKLISSLSSLSHKELGIAIGKVHNNVYLLKKIDAELKKMKEGSYVVTHQIRAISKIRIIAPILKNDYFDNIVLSSKTMENINRKLDEMIKK